MPKFTPQKKVDALVAKLHAKIADCRKDFLHKLTTQLVRENQAIYTETLEVKNMMANHKLAQAIADCGATPRRRQAFILEWGQGNAHQESGWGETLRQLEYKCLWHGRTMGSIDRWFPSSKLCNSCGHILDKLPLNIREWTCPRCNSHHKRDVNAAKNILAVGTCPTDWLGNADQEMPTTRAVGLTVIACGDTSGGEIELLSSISSYVSVKQESPDLSAGASILLGIEPG